MITDKISALITLLDDPDHEVYNAISYQLLRKGETIIPELEKAWENSPNEIVQNRIEDILQRIQLNSAYNGLKHWIDSGAEDILLGAYWVARNQYPELNFKQIERTVDKIKTNIWLEIDDSLTALEKTNIINHFIYDVYNFGSDKKFMQSNYYFINNVLSTNKGNAISLSILYIAICQRLNLPVYGVCIPRNFLVVYYDPLLVRELFYLNPFYKGAPLSRADIESYLKQTEIIPKEEYFQACSNKTTILRLIQTIAFIYEHEENNMPKAKVYKKLVDLFGDEQTYFLEDKD